MLAHKLSRYEKQSACCEGKKVHPKMCVQQRHGIILPLAKLFHGQHQALRFRKAVDHLERMESRRIKISRKRD